jgi:probable F420-dependent oxidoreductase
VPTVVEGAGGSSSPIRFGLSAIGFRHAGELVARARWAEGVGFSTFSVSDHLNAPSPFVTLQAISSATSTMRLGTLVINNDLRHPAVLAQEAATIDQLSGGRLELGLGAGWALPEYVRAGIAFDPPSVRIGRLAESVAALRELFAGDVVSTAGDHVRLDHHLVVPRPPQGASLPLLIGGNGDRLLRLAAQTADIVGFTGFSPDREGHNHRTHFDRSGLAERVAFVRQQAGDRADQVELNILLQMLVITDDRELLARMHADRHGESYVRVLTSPFLAFGTVDEICLQLTRLYEDYGITYVTVFNQYADDAARVLAELG